MKKLLSLMATAVLVSSSVTGISFAAGAAPAHPMTQGKTQGKMPADHKNGCATVSVKTKTAMLKAMPSMGARTYRMAKQGEKFTIVMDGGRVHHWDGFWLVKAANGYRYWVHQSVLNCM